MATNHIQNSGHVLIEADTNDSGSGDIFLKVRNALRARLTQAKAIFTVPIELPAAPTQDLEAATKKYVDDSVLDGGAILSKSAAEIAGLTPGQIGREFYDTTNKRWVRDFGSSVGFRHATANYNAFEIGIVPTASDSTTRAANNSAWTAWISSVPNGASIEFPEGVFYFNTKLTVNKMITIKGAGAGFNHLDVCTKIVVESGQTGFEFVNGASGSKVSNLSIMTRSGYSGVSTGDGVYSDVTVKLDNLYIGAFGRDGIFLNGFAPANSDFSVIDTVHCTLNKRDGIHLDGGGDTNVINVRSCNTYQNGRFGVYNTGSVNTYLGHHADGNGLLTAPASAITSGAITGSASPQTVTLSNVTSMAVGDLIKVNTGSNAEYVIITALPGSNQVTGVFTRSHLGGTAVVGLNIDYFENGSSNCYLNPYSESPGKFFLSDGSIYGYIQFGLFGAPEILTNVPGGINGNTVILQSGSWRNVRLRDFYTGTTPLEINLMSLSGWFYIQAGGLENLLSYDSTNRESIFTKLAYSGTLRSSGTPQTLTGAGAVNLTTDTTLLVTTGADALTLANGSEGQIKKVMMKTDGGDGTLTPTNRAGYSSIVFNDVGDTVTLQFQDGKWWIIGSYGVTIS